MTGGRSNGWRLGIETNCWESGNGRFAMTTEMLERSEILAADEHAESLLRKASANGRQAGSRKRRSLVKNWKTLPSGGTTRLFVVCTLEDLTHERIAQIHKLRGLKGRDKVFLLLKGNMPSAAVADRIVRLNVRDGRRIHLVDMDNVNEEDFAERLLLALDSDADEHRILDAWWENKTLVVVSANRSGLEKLRVPLSELPALKGQQGQALGVFEIDEDGIFIYWPELDVHLGWEQFATAIDQRAYLRAKQQATTFNRSYGKAIRKLREQHHLRQSDIKGLTPRQVGRIERGQCRATHTALTKLAKAHQLTLPDYMNKLASLM